MSAIAGGGLMRILRWILWGFGGLALLAAAVLAWIYAASEAHYRSFAAPPPFVHPIPEDAAAIAWGEHIARTRGCRGCHGEALEGEIMGGMVVTPNLPALARRVSPAALEAAIRHGVGHNGRALYSMPAYNFLHLTDADTAALIAYLRAAPVSTAAPAGALRPWHERWPAEVLMRLAIARGEDAAMPAWLHHVPPLREQANPDPRIAQGEYLAMTSCNECHGFNLRGFQPWAGESAPDLIVLAAYSEQDFTRLMREGAPISGAQLEMMGPVARGRFAHWSDEEVAALYAYLSRLAAEAVAQEP
ncbi:MAG: c-type cytochrome [Hyphomonadaceae bacterium]|nr:c-type cytochrome [Hyphomonadaceae bacterium]